MVELALNIMSGLLGLSVSAGFIALILKAHRHYQWPAREEEYHHAHKVSIPRFGGMAWGGAFVSFVLFFSAMGGQSFLQEAEYWTVVTGSLAMFGLGLWDDFRALGAKRK